MCKDKLRAEIQEIQKCPLEVGLEAANHVCEEGVDKKSQHYMRHWIWRVQAADMKEPFSRFKIREMRNTLATVR